MHSQKTLHVAIRSRKMGKLTREATWMNLGDIQKTFRDTEPVEGHVVFNIARNKCRLIAAVTYQIALVQIERVLTHSEYNREMDKCVLSQMLT